MILFSMPIAMIENPSKSPKSKLTKNQQRTIAFFQEKTKQNRAIRSQELKSTEGASLTKEKIPASLPLSVTREAQEDLARLRNEDFTKLVFPKGFVNHGPINAMRSGGESNLVGTIRFIHKTSDETIFPDFGMKLDKNEKGLDLVFRHPNTPPSVYSLFQKQQGDLAYQNFALNSFTNHSKSK